MATSWDCISPLLTVNVDPMMPSLVVLALNHSSRQEASLFRPSLLLIKLLRCNRGAICTLRVSALFCLPNVHLHSQDIQWHYERVAYLNLQLNWKYSQCGWSLYIFCFCLVTQVTTFKISSVNEYAAYAAFGSLCRPLTHLLRDWFPVNFFIV